MKVILFTLIYLITNQIFAGDIRNLAINTDMYSLSEKGYVNFKCKYGKKKIKSWKDFKTCMISESNTYYINFEYDEKYAFNENFEGTQVAGHPVIIDLGIDEKGLLKEINVATDPNVPFYFRKQAYLMWLRIYAKYGSEDWVCKNFDKENDHIIIGKKYINRICDKNINNKKSISVATEFYFKNGKKDKENLVSRTSFKIYRNNKTS